MNDWADFWRYKIGVNVIPADTRNKIPKVNWKQHQKEPTSEEQHNKWKEEGAFNDGMAIIAGRVWHIPLRKGLYLICVDLDNQLAIDEFCTRNGVRTPLTELAKKIIIEQHRDEPNKAHVIFYATHPFPKKSSDVASLPDQLDHNEVPAIEVKGAGEHGLLFCTPSPHKNGYNYEVIGTTDLEEVHDQLYDHIQDICKRYGIQYPANSNESMPAGRTTDLTPIKDLFNPDTKILKGHNRHEALLRVMESLLKRNQNILEEYKIRELAEDWNMDHCQPPLEWKEVEKQWKAAVKFIEEHNRRRAQEQRQQQERREREVYEQELRDSEELRREQKVPLSIDVLARLNEEGKSHYGAGLLSSLGGLYKMVRATEVKCSVCGSYRKTTFVHPEPYSYYFYHFANVTLAKCQFYFNTTCNGHLKVTPEFVSAVDIEVSDPNSLQDLDKLRYILFAGNTKDVGIGENVTILGTIHMHTPKIGGPTYPVAYADNVQYVDREQEELTRLDIEAIKRFRKRFSDDSALTNKLVSMMACNVIGHNNIKEGILYMVSNAKPDKRERRERIHGAIISMPGRAKTALLMYATKLMTRSTFETAQMATGLSLLAIVEKEGEMKILRLGPVARSLFASIDEFNKLNNIDQEKFYGLMQEGYFTSNKFGRNQRIVAPVTILASMNPPEGSTLSTDGRIDLADMNVIRPIWDRFDLKLYIPPMRDEKERRELANAKADLEGREIPDYSKFIKKWLMYAKQHFNPKLTEEAKSIRVEAYMEMSKYNSAISPRRLDALFNLARARARLLLKSVAGPEDARAIVEFYGMMIKDYETGTIAPRDPIDIGVDECMRILNESILGNEPVAYTQEELFIKMCESNPQVDKYLRCGVAKRNVFDRSNNKKARAIYERLMAKHPEIQVVSKSPTTLLLPLSKNKDKAQSDQSDQSDRSKTPTEGQVSDLIEPGEGKTENTEQARSSSSGPESSDFQVQLSIKSGSERSERSDSNSDFPARCYYCNHTQHKTRDEYNTHCVLTHEGKPAYPGLADIRKLGLVSQGMRWEN